MADFPKFLVNLNPYIYLSDNYLTVDFETSSLDYGSALNPDNTIILGAFGDDSALYGTDKFDKYIEKIKKVDFIVAHNAKFELQWLYRLGVEPGSVLAYDTLLSEYVNRGNIRGPLDLDSVCRQYGIKGKESVVSQWIQSGIDPRLIPQKRLREYCVNDVEITHELFLKQRVLLEERGLLPVFFTRCLTTLVLSEIESRGMCIDKEEVTKEFRKELEKSRTILQDLSELTGGINPKSPKQVGVYLYDTLGFCELTNYRKEPNRTPTGGRKTDEDTVSQLDARTDEQKRFIDLFRSYIPIKKRLETLTKLYECSQGGEHLYAQFNQAVTATHRLSSSGKKYKVQFQNIDRDLKKLFKSRNEGWQIGDADAVQLEWHVAAFEGKDPKAYRDILDHFDVHLNTAAVMLNKPMDKVTKKERTEKKPWTFKPVFGGKSGTPDERRYYKAFQKKYNVLYKEQMNWTNEVLLNKQYRASSGLIFYWPGVKLHDSGYIEHTTEIFNYRIQSFATADIIPITLIYMWYKMRGMESFITNTVHDSIVAEVKPEERDEWERITKEAFTTDVFNYLEVVYGVKFDVPLAVNYGMADHWGMGEDKEYEVVPQTIVL